MTRFAGSTLKIDHSFIVEGERFCHKPADAQILGLKKCSECQLLAILTEGKGLINKIVGHAYDTIDRFHS